MTHLIIGIYCMKTVLLMMAILISCSSVAAASNNSSFEIRGGAGANSKGDIYDSYLDLNKAKKPGRHHPFFFRDRSGIVYVALVSKDDERFIVEAFPLDVLIKFYKRRLPSDPLDGDWEKWRIDRMKFLEDLESKFPIYKTLRDNYFVSNDSRYFLVMAERSLMFAYAAADVMDNKPYPPKEPLVKSGGTSGVSLSLFDLMFLDVPSNIIRLISACDPLESGRGWKNIEGYYALDINCDNKADYFLHKNKGEAFYIAFADRDGSGHGDMAVMISETFMPLFSLWDDNFDGEYEYSGFHRNGEWEPYEKIKYSASAKSYEDNSNVTPSSLSVSKKNVPNRKNLSTLIKIIKIDKSDFTLSSEEINDSNSARGKIREGREWAIKRWERVALNKYNRIENRNNKIALEQRKKRNIEEAKRKKVQEEKERLVLEKHITPARHGDAISQSWLGHYYLNGKGGLDIDHGKAYEWFEKSADQGNAYAQYNIGYLYYINYLDDDKHDSNSLWWLKKSASTADSDVISDIKKLLKKMRSRRSSRLTRECSFEEEIWGTVFLDPCINSVLREMYLDDYDFLE